jgi:translation elongation factor EF-Tu-like GTPase
MFVKQVFGRICNRGIRKVTGQVENEKVRPGGEKEDVGGKVKKKTRKVMKSWRRR